MTLCDSCEWAGVACEIWPQHELLRCAEYRHKPAHEAECDSERLVFGDCTCDDE